MTCRPAPACRHALDEATALHPDRSRASDGICASAQHHQQNPDSDHEPDQDGEATAFDLTHDPGHGCDVDEKAQLLIDRRDQRVKYLIRSRRILRSYDKPGIPAWTWAPYHGPNPHDKHLHVSVLQAHKHSTADWWTPQEDTLTDELRQYLDAIKVDLGKQIAAVRSEVQAVRTDLSNQVDTLGDSVHAVRESVAGRGKIEAGKITPSLLGRLEQTLSRIEVAVGEIRAKVGG